MSAKNYPITPAKIGDRDGFRLSPDFSQDYPDLANSSGYVQVLSDNTLLVRLDTNKLEAEEEEESLSMSLFLDFLMKYAMENPEKLVPYTEEMSAEIDDLLTDVTVE
jgi:antitoxin PrlF